MIKSNCMRVSLLLAAALMFCIAMPVMGAVSGVVTSDGPGNPAIAGARVRTEGDPGFSSTTATDGSYTLSTTPGTYTVAVLVSAAGYYPQRQTVSVSGGTGLIANFSLRAAPTGGQISLPAPLDSGEPPSAPTPPGDAFGAAFADMSNMPASGAPQITGFNETVKPNESFTVAGDSFTTRTGADAGTDTTVWVWADTPTGGVLKQAQLWRVTDKTLTALMPADIPFGMYLIWIENSIGASMPVCINKATAHWVGPLGNGVQAGNKVRVYGRNLTRNHSTNSADSYVYIQSSTGGSMVLCATDSANPYMVQFSVPVGTPNGNYKAFVHNGHGARYGWSDALDLIVRDDWVRGASQVNLSPNGTDDTTAIQNAINQMSAQPNGGTVNLSAGSFKTYAPIWVYDKVRLVGAGMDTTTIQLRSRSGGHDYVSYHGSHISIESLTLNACLDSVAPPTYSIMAGPYPTFQDNVADDMKFINLRVTGDFGTILAGCGLGYHRSEASGCEFYRQVGIGWAVDMWIHNCTLYGGPYGIWDDTRQFMTDAAFTPGNTTTFEYNHIETKDWPVNPNNGSTNYMDWYQQVYGTWDTIGYKVWAKRVAMMGGSYSNTYRDYFAYCTTKDVAVQDNQGEMMLCHGAGQSWFGNMLSENGLTVNLRTDGTVNGVAVRMSAPYSSTASDGGQDGGTTVPDIYPHWRALDGQYLFVIAGKGLGQCRQIISHTSTSVTIDRPWRIQPDTASVLSIDQAFLDNTIYKNDLNAFPPNYVQDYSASRGIMFESCAQNSACEGNASHRTNGGRDIFGMPGGPSNWNVMRDEQATDCHTWGYDSFFEGASPLGPTLIGNAFRNCTANILASADNGGISMYGEGCIAEGTNITGKMGFCLPGVAPPLWYDTLNKPYPDGFVLYRNGSATVTDSPLAVTPATMEPVYIGMTDGKQFLINNSYSGSSQTYFLGTGLSAYSTPAPMYRLARFTGYAGTPAQAVMVPVANAGIAPMSWTATPSDSWISATIQSNPTVSAESGLGRLLINVDPTGMSTGTHWGSVTVTTGSQNVKIGVRFDLLAGSPTNTPPVASFSAVPASGLVPLTVSFNAGASYDPDGSIQSYAWDFADGSLATGTSISHTFTTAGTYTVAMTVTDNSGASATNWTNVTVAPVLAGVTLSSSLNPPVNASTPVVLTANAIGGYQVQYKFLVNNGTGWQTLRDYQTTNTCTWTPATNGCYELKAYARNTGSTNSYDAATGTLSFPVGVLPTSGMALWLKADAGVSKTAANSVTSWADQVSGSSKTVGQSNPTYQPVWQDAVLNGKPVIHFSGNSCALGSSQAVLTGSGGFTAFTVGRFIGSSGNYQYFWWNGTDSTTGGYGPFVSTTPRLRTSWGTSSYPINLAPSPVVGTWYRASSRYAGGLHEGWLNGTFVASNNPPSSNLLSGFTVGNYAGSAQYQGLIGDIAEIVIYSRNLSEAERQGVESYLTTRWTAPVPVAVDRLKDVKALADGVMVTLTSAKVATAASGTYSDGGIYVSEIDRTAGMKVTGAGAVNTGDNLTLSGTTDTEASGERVLRVTSVSTGVNTPVAALGMGNKPFSATGQLVTVWGKVVSVSATSFKVDDGSGAPVTVETDGLVTPLSALPTVGQYLSACGPAGLMSGTPAVRVRSASDIHVY